MKYKLLFVILILRSFFSLAQNLDPDFGLSGGIVTSQLSTSTSNDYTRGGVMLPDGKMLVYGGFDVIRLTASNVLDTSFNFCGFKSVGGLIYGLAIQSDGKIVIAKKNTIIRLNPDGSVDSSFTSPDLTAYTALAISAITIDAVGKVFFVGSFKNETYYDIIVGSLNADGSFNIGFNASGITIVNLPGTNEFGINLKIEPSSGKIFVCGTKEASNGTGADFFLTRFTNTGDIDVFGSNGLLVFDHGFNDVLTDMDFQSDGKLIVVGTSTSPSIAPNGTTVYTPVGYLIARRINTDGSLDQTLSYNQWGYYNTLFSPTMTLKPAVKIIASDKIVITGSSCFVSAATAAPAIIKLDVNGNYDSSFVGSAVGYNDANNGALNFTCFLLQRADGSFVVGSRYNDTLNSNSVIRLVNFSATGPYLNEINLNLIHGNDNVISMVEQTNGKSLALVTVAGIGAVLERYNNNGSLDPLFGNDGTGVQSINPQASTLVQQADGKLLVSNSDGTLNRYSQDGILDTGFASSGVFNLFSLNNTGVSFNIAFGNNKIYIMTIFEFNTFALNCLNYDGTIDTTFGSSGIATFRFDYFDVSETESPLNIYIQSDNKIVVLTYLKYNNEEACGIVRFNSDGSIDASFGTDGKIILPQYNFIDCIKISQSNKIVVLAFDTNTGFNTMLQFNNDGSIPSDFGINGTVSDLEYPNTSYDMIIQPDGKILYAVDDRIYRYTTNGTLDSSFGTNGVLSTTVYTNFDHYINKLLWTQSGKLFEAGNAFTGSKYVGTLIRYTDLTLGLLDFDVAENKIMVYPNPIASDATFSYTLQEDSAISITVVDIMGRVVKTIRANEMQNAGDHQQNVAIGELASGNYLLVFTSPKGTQTVKLIKRN
jgi:uncharacterized delta-60 repeat protein